MNPSEGGETEVLRVFWVVFWGVGGYGYQTLYKLRVPPLCSAPSANLLNRRLAGVNPNSAPALGGGFL